MLWFILFCVVVFVIASNRIKTKKAQLNESDLELLNKYKEGMKGKFIIKRPDDLTEWEKHIWILASEELGNEGNKKYLKWFGYFFLALFVFIIIGLFFGRL